MIFVAKFIINDPLYHRLLYGPKINIEDEDIKKGSIPEWKLQPKVSYDDDEGDDQFVTSTEPIVFSIIEM